MQVRIRVEKEGRYVYINALRTTENDYFEEWHLIGRDRTVVVRNNYPVLMRKGLKYRPAAWKIVKGQINNVTIYDDVLKALCKQLGRAY